MLTDMPYKIINAFTSNLPLYFMINLRRDAGEELQHVDVAKLISGAFFFYLLISFTCTLAMSSLFRLLAAASRSLIQALLPTTIIMVGLVMYAGFSIPVQYMRGWAAWMRFLNPIYYALESLLINEFEGRSFTCTEIVPSGPGYEGIESLERSCSALGSEVASLQVDGTRYIEVMYEASVGNKWRNFGILLAFAIGLGAFYLLASGMSVPDI
jgi:ATP-binding cassette subfamily G (WHITE) protein 2 (PDR)